MKFFLSISMSFLFLFQGIAGNMEFCEEIEKISDFVAHYQEHNNLNGDSFFDFVYENYIADNPSLDNHHTDSESDNSPVHSNHQCCQHFVFFSPFQFSSISIAPKVAQNQFDFYNFQFNSRALESLFQPPKV